MNGCLAYFRKYYFSTKIENRMKKKKFDDDDDDNDDDVSEEKFEYF